MIDNDKLERIKADARERRNKAIIALLTPLTVEQARVLLDDANAKMELARAFGDQELFLEYLKTSIDAGGTGGLNGGL